MVKKLKNPQKLKTYKKEEEDEMSTDKELVKNSHTISHEEISSNSCKNLNVLLILLILV